MRRLRQLAGRLRPRPVPAQPRRHRVLALTAFRDEMDYLPGLFDSIGPHVDGVIALDDGSTDGSGDYAASRPEVVQLLQVPPGTHEECEDAILRRMLITAAWDHEADWLLGIDADERPEHAFGSRMHSELDRADELGAAAMWVRFVELWEPGRARVDGVWGQKKKACLFRSDRSHGFDDRRLHTHWASLPEPPDSWPQADLRLYHLRMLDPARRQARVDRYQRLDPDRVHQALGYDYLVDETGIVLEDVEDDRDYR